MALETKDNLVCQWQIVDVFGNDDLLCTGMTEFELTSVRKKNWMEKFEKNSTKLVTLPPPFPPASIFSPPRSIRASQVLVGGSSLASITVKCETTVEVWVLSRQDFVKVLEDFHKITFFFCSILNYFEKCFEMFHEQITNNPEKQVSECTPDHQ